MHRMTITILCNSHPTPRVFLNQVNFEIYCQRRLHYKLISFFCRFLLFPIHKLSVSQLIYFFFFFVSSPYYLSLQILQVCHRPRRFSRHRLSLLLASRAALEQSRLLFQQECSACFRPSRRMHYSDHRDPLPAHQLLQVSSPSLQLCKHLHSIKKQWDSYHQLL